MTDSTKKLLLLLQREICEKEDTDFPSPLQEEELISILQAAQNQDLLYPAVQALHRIGFSAQTSPTLCAFRQKILQNVLRGELLMQETDRICDAFNEEQLPHILLKGAHLRRYYPSPLLRTSADLDILVRASDIPQAQRILSQQLHYTYIRTGSHDKQFSSPSGVLLELHFTLSEAELSTAAADILADVWENTVSLEATPYTHLLSPEYLYFHQITHMCKHFLYSGLGIRFFLDLWILQHCAPQPDAARMSDMLTKAGLTAFAKTVEELAESWFSGTPMTELASQMENYILSGGVFGSTQTRVQMEHLRHKSRLKYMLNRLFLPYQTMKVRYPLLKVCPLLLPFCHVFRWFRLLSAPTARRIGQELQSSRNITPEQMADLQSLMNRLGL